MRYRHSTLPAGIGTSGAVTEAAGKSTFRVPGRTTRPGGETDPVPDPAAERPVEPMASAASTAPADPELLTGYVDVVAITEVTRDVKTFELRAPWMDSLDFEPGQYVTLRVPELALERCYSISSAPFGTNTFTITVKRVSGGPVSNHLHDAVGAGGRLHADGPYGLFSTSFHPAEKHLFLSGGTGITPIMSMVRSLLAEATGDATDIVVVHSASTPADIIFRAELEQLAQVPGVRVEILCSCDSESETWTGRRGRITADTLAEVAPDLADRETFLCGPGGYMDAVRALLVELGSAGAHEESFAFATSPAARLSRAAVSVGADRSTGVLTAVGGAGAGGWAAKEHTIEFAGSSRRVECAPEMTVLDAALRTGLEIPSSCSEGMCGTCKSDLISGEVEMHHAGGIRPKEIAAGKFLPCCSTPLTDLTVGR